MEKNLNFDYYKISNRYKVNFLLPYIFIENKGKFYLPAKIHMSDKSYGIYVQFYDGNIEANKNFVPDINKSYNYFDHDINKSYYYNFEHPFNFFGDIWIEFYLANITDIEEHDKVETIMNEIINYYSSHSKLNKDTLLFYKFEN